MELTYRQEGDYLLPNLMLPQEPDLPLGKYAHMRLEYLKNRRPIIYTNLKTTCKLREHLYEIEQEALNRIRELTADMAKAEGVTEQLKAEDQMKWVGLMNNLRHSAEEIVLGELIYK